MHALFLRRACVAASAALIAARAIGDVGPPLFVANDGVDRGDCSDPVAPCRSIGYALDVAGKNAQIKVAAGSYEITDPSDAIYMVSGAVSVSGGYRREVGLSPAADGRSMISGVPLEYRDLMRERGFHVIVDTKGLDIEQAATARALLQQYEQAQISAVSAPCENGSAGGFACSGVDLLAHVARGDISASPTSVADIWGFVDLNTNREYAIVGVSVGTAVFDVTDPENPREVGFIDGQAATWRDIKVHQFFDDAGGRWQAYAYVTTDGASDGLFVIDLGGLPHGVRRAPYLSDFSNAHNVYVTNTDYGTGVSLTPDVPQVIVAGSGIGQGQFRTYSLANPASPAFVQGLSSAGYMHDASSLRISDQRTAQCADPGMPCEVLLDFNENNVEIWDITAAANPIRLAQVSRYPDTGYVHSGWWSEDRRHMFVHDELDERDSVLFTTLRVFSLSDLSNPVLEGIWTGPTTAIDHNGFVRGNRYYMSTYTRGLTVLDISDPVTPVESGFFDTYGASDDALFAGAWGAYPFFPSGTVAVSDINSGMYLLADRTLDVAQGRLSFSATSYAATEGQQATLTVERQGGSSGSVSVDYEILAATADGSDYQPASGALGWGPGDVTDRSIVFDIPSDGVAEPLERLIVRLVNPAGGATLGARAMANLYLADPGTTSEIRPFADSIEVAERGFGRAIIVLHRAGSAAGAASVDFSIGAGDAVLDADFQGPASGTVSWADGDGDPKAIEYTLVDDGVGEADEFFEVSLSNGLTTRVTIADGLGSNAAPNAIAGMDQSHREGSIVTLNGSQSNDPDGDALTFAWSQTSGPAVALSNPASASATFRAPSVSSDTMFQFQLRVTDPRGLSDVATTNVTITNDASSRSGGSGSSAPLALLLLGLLGASRRAVRPDRG